MIRHQNKSIKLNRHRFERKTGFRPRNVIFVISTEGKETEPIYFRAFNNLSANVHCEVLPSKSGSASPSHVFKRAKEKSKKIDLRKNDEIWVVIDRDNRHIEQVKEVFYMCKKAGIEFAISNPKFELWLLLHFEFPSARTINTSQDCTERLRKYISNYEKSHFDVNKIILKANEAIERAEKNYSDFDPLSDTTGTNVHLLVKKIVESSSKP